MAWSHDGTRIASGSIDKSVSIWDVSTSRVVAQYMGHADMVKSLAWSPSDRSIVSGDKNEFHVWDALDGRSQAVYRGHRSGGLFTLNASSAAWSPDGASIASVNAIEHEVHLWDAYSGRLLLMCSGHTKGLNAVAWSPDGRQIASGGWDATVRFWNVSNGAEMFRFVNQGMGGTEVLALSWAPDGRLIALGDAKGRVRLMQSV